MEQKYNVLVKVPANACDCGRVKAYEWKPVRPTDGPAYEFTLRDAKNYIEIYSLETGSPENFKLVKV